MRRIQLFVACCLLIVASVPLLPGPGALVIAETIAILELEFPWVRRLLDAVQSAVQGTVKPPRIAPSVPPRRLAISHRDVTRKA
jgi:hypothetical protein